jgi:hypothetical protein
MIETAVTRCSRAPRLVWALLEEDEPAIDQAHLASCPTCRREAERVRRFVQALAAAAVDAAETIPEPASLGGRHGMGARLVRRTRRVAPVVALAGAVAAGLVVAAIVGTRPAPPTGDAPTVFRNAAIAVGALAPLGLECEAADPGFRCEATAPDHVHRAVLTTEDGHVIEVSLRIESTDGGPLNVSGVSDYFARVAAAVVRPEVRSGAQDWIRGEYATCGSACATDLDTIRLGMTTDASGVGLSLRER